MRKVQLNSLLYSVSYGSTFQQSVRSKKRQSQVSDLPFPRCYLWRFTEYRPSLWLHRSNESLWASASYRFASPIPGICVQTWRHPKNRKYIKYRRRGGPSDGHHRLQVPKIWKCGFRDMQEYGQADGNAS